MRRIRIFKSAFSIGRVLEFADLFIYFLGFGRFGISR